MKMIYLSAVKNLAFCPDPWSLNIDKIIAVTPADEGTRYKTLIFLEEIGSLMTELSMEQVTDKIYEAAGNNDG